MMVNVIDFSEALKEAEVYKNKHLLLGNGFSIACKPDIFTYPSLYNKAKEKMSSEIVNIFEKMGTQDFEEVIRALQNTAMITSAYSPKLKNIINTINKEAEALKEHLITTVAKKHPKRPDDITDDRYRACRSFLSNFIKDKKNLGKIYTMNYDLLLYWTLMHEEETEPFTLKKDDGFRTDPNSHKASYVEWQGEGAAIRDQNIHYLHGALHLFDAKSQLQKYTWINTGEALVNQVERALENNMFPLFVAEGDSESKKAKIMHNAYLHHNLKSFATLCGLGKKNYVSTALFVYGHSFAENDNHILDMIGHGTIRHLFISLYGDPDSENNRVIIKNVDRIAGLRTHELALSVTYFDAVSARVWG